MLDELSVRNLGVITSARITPGPGLVVVSGETGAGKTMLFGALELLSGLPAKSSVVGPDGEEAVIEGRFVMPDSGEVVVSRRVRSEGRSRAYLNGDMATLRDISEAMSGLVEIVSQHDHLALGREEEVRGLVDKTLDIAGLEALSDYRLAWEAFAKVSSRRGELEIDPGALERERDLVAWQAEEISKAGFSIDDDVELVARAGRLRHAEQLTESLGAGYQAAAAVQDVWGEVVENLRSSVAVDEDLAEVAKEVQNLAEMLRQTISDIRSASENVVHDPAELELTEERLRLLSDLRRKYGPTLSEILGFAETASLRAHELDSLMTQAGSISAEWDSAHAQVLEAARALTNARALAAARLTDDAKVHLQELGFSDPVISVELAEVEPRAHGCDSVVLSFASDSRLTPGPVARVASGGELSRLVLALRLAGGVGEAPVVAFDEIDAGVGGRTALELGRKLAELARGKQVLVVTHLPQVAAFASTHLVIEREGAVAVVKQLDRDGQISELSRMLAGLDDSQKGRDHAIELRSTALAQLSGD